MAYDPFEKYRTTEPEALAAAESICAQVQTLVSTLDPYQGAVLQLLCAILGNTSRAGGNTSGVSNAILANILTAISGLSPGSGTSLGGDGRKVVTTAGTRVALVASPTPAKKVTVVGEWDNTKEIVVGGNTVVAALATRRGEPLGPGQSTQINVTDLADVYIDSLVNGEGVTFVYEV